ncbi:hypothetical protein RNZ50_13670 [Paracoccaceae bacterium Fryx2]|nr:hypothetical protein [Paracoccaceae bacterium Fryx2]
MISGHFGLVAACAAGLAGAALAQGFTTAAEIRPILEATRTNWVALREFDGQDLLHFTHLESWRCGLAEVRYGVNGAAPEVWAMDPCFEGTAQPHAIAAGREPYIRLPLGSVQAVSVLVTYDDGATDMADFTRAQVLMP